MKNIETKPEDISADTIYLSQISLTYLANNEINGLIPTKKTIQRKIERLNKSPFHKDHLKH